jgi:hypothetical protein
MKNISYFIFSFIFSSYSLAQGIWDRDVEILNPRENIFQLEPQIWKETVIKGQRHVVNYPVTTTELLIPYGPLKYFFEEDQQNPFKKYIFNKLKSTTHIKNFSDFEQWLGLNSFNQNGQGIYQIHNPNQDKNLRMGTTLMQRDGAVGFTFGCATCHTGNLFGTSVLGLTNRFPKANEFFVVGKKAEPFVDTTLFKTFLEASDEDVVMLKRSLEATKFIGAKKPLAIGLDTSLASVALSLSRRGTDEYALKKYIHAFNPRPNPLDKIPADSKPMPWWNVKYKNRWLSDGSVVSGNPIFTNFLWNEIGRGADLKKLESWMVKNQETIDELTATVFATKAPRYTDFFPAESINLESAKRGEKLYLNSCKKCHGVYEKAWNQENAKQLSLTQALATVKVHYAKKTKVVDVGTDPYRYQGVQYFAADLNRLKISKMANTIVEPQKGYVPPPLVGIWARWPYFHNNSVPNLCMLLTPGSKRVKTYYAGEAIDREIDFDQDCNGYPLGNKVNPTWIKEERLYDSSRMGLSNLGHDEGILIKDGIELLSPEDKKDLIQFLKTL